MFSPALSLNSNSSIVFVSIGVLFVASSLAFYMFKTQDRKTWLELAVGTAGTLLITSNKLVADMIMASLDEEQSMGEMLFGMSVSCAAGVSVYLLFNYSVNHLDPVTPT
jgi:hypothetical protein